MRKYFFCAKNLDDYRKTYQHLVAKEKAPDESLEDFEQKFFLAHIKNLFKVSDEVFDSAIYGETGIDGLRLDFNFGLRLDVPEGNFRVVIGDADTGEIFFDKYISGGRLISVEQYFIRWRVKVFLDGKKVFEHKMRLEGQKVLLALRLCGLGDSIALLPFAQEFSRRHRCDVLICLPDYLCEFAANLYPDIPQVDAIRFQTYATYYLTFVMATCLTVPVDIRNIPMERAGGSLLGVETLPPKPTFTPTASRFFPEPYVCIGVQASTPTKGWLYPGGWEIVVDYLKNLGYRVFCIDKQKVQSKGNYTATMPTNTEDFTGDFSIMDRANLLYYAEFFIGLSSGLAWVADAAGCPVIMICGFSQDWFEFYTPYRVANRLACNGCFNDVRVAFMNGCPYHKNTAREFECQKKISPLQVINAIERLILDRNLMPPIVRS